MEEPDDRHWAEQEEVEFILSSGLFRRAPRSELFLAYICARFLEGRAEDLKEYTIGVEALGRPADFDPERDASVRVAAHRVRKRLDHFYRTEGAGRPIRISIPSGKYVPEFIRQEAPVPGLSEGRFRQRKFLLAIAAAVLLVAYGILTQWWMAPPRTREAGKTNPAAKATAVTMDDVRIAAGASEGFRDRFGNIWSADQYVSGGVATATPAIPIDYAIEPRLFTHRRVCAAGDRFEYAIPLRPGTYDLRLHFAESSSSGRQQKLEEGARTTNIYLNGRLAVRGLDVFGQVGFNAALVKVFRNISPGPDGRLRIMIAHRDAFLNGLEILRSPRGKMRPLRMVASTEPYVDLQGRVWLPDHYVQGGVLVRRSDPVTGTDEPGLFRGERFGRFNYLIPVGPGKYTVSFRFAETYFGPSFAHPRTGGPGSRVFDILLNQQILQRRFDILRETGGVPYRAVERVFNGIEPDANGNLSLGFVAASNYPCLCALEVVEE